MSGERRAPVNGAPGGSIAWSEHVKAWEAYHRTHDQQSAQRIAERGGFGIEELVTQLGHMPLSWEPDARTRFMPGVTFVPAPARPADPDRDGEANRAQKCEPCLKYMHGGCQGHRVPCECTCGDASDGGRLG